ncbi:hypothetical protein PHYBOEH_001106 [Phytophthora boehmeriae]|uniref:Rhodanese domain-containing protein n=1 Tax=Phytophthora boehmeriae TaxID=109152 RepID=A0A8T1WYB1_9STRA|nr:hypothetical protein PHYBOEH_001106 [Phytophthora boehmeriae]
MMLSSLRARCPPLLRSSALTRPSFSRCFSALVDCDFVHHAQKSGDPKLFLLDCNHPASYPRGHIPEAVPLVSASSLLKDPSPNATGVVSKDQFYALMASLHVPKDATLVFYDDEMSLKATRMWWVFRHFGYPVDRLKVLDGGVKQWAADNNEVAIGAFEQDKKEDKTLWKDIKETDTLVGFNAVQQGIKDKTTQFVDARSPGEFWGEDANGNKRTGHVPGAVNFNWMEGVDFARNGKFKSKEELDAILVDILQLDKQKPVITYCQRGIRAAHTAFALEQIMGFKDVKIYEDSMLQYLNRDDSEVEKK